MNRRFIAFFLSLVFWSQLSHAETKRISLLLKARDNPFYDAIYQGARERAQDLNFEVVRRFGKNEDDWQEQIAALREPGEEFDGFVLVPTRSDVFEEVLSELQKKKRPVVIVDTPLTKGADQALTTITSDNFAGGKLAGKYMVGQIGFLPEKKSCIVLFSGNPNAKTHQDRNAGFKEVVKKSRPDLKIIEFIAYSSRQKALEIAKANLPTLEKCYGVFAGSDTMIMGVMDAFETHRKRVPTIMIGYDSILDVQRYILEGKLKASVQQSPTEMGRQAISAFADYFRGVSVNKTKIIYPKLTVQSPKLDALSDFELDILLRKPPEPIK